MTLPDYVIQASAEMADSLPFHPAGLDAYYDAEWDRCADDPVYFINTYCQIYDAEASDWIPFSLWSAQIDVINLFLVEQLLIALKARQIGLTWLFLALALWLMIFHPIATVLLFSKRDDEAVYLLGRERLRGMYERLPGWMKARATPVIVAAHIFSLSNGSICRAFPTTAGDSYTATLAIVDEADLVPDLKSLLASVKPTIEAGGKLALISRVDKSTPNSMFKQIYRAAKQGLNTYAAIFLGWFTRPGRDQAWYERQCADSKHNTGALDQVYEQYPATDAQALAANTLDKRIAAAWLLQCYQEMQPLTALPKEAPAIPQLEIYRLPEPGHEYVIGADPAEGNPTSDDSALTVIDRKSWEEVAALAGKIEPTIFAGYIDAIGLYYNRAPVMPERNNHCHTVIAGLRNTNKLAILSGLDDKDGWLTNSKANIALYDDVADALRNKNCVLHSFGTYTQLSAIEGSTLEAPAGDHDDRADTYGLAIQGAKRYRRYGGAWL